MAQQGRDFSNQRVTVMGLGHHGGGVAAVQFLAARGARVTVTDLADEASLAESLQQIADLPLVGIHCGAHREADFCEADLLVVNPAVRGDSPMLRLARESGVTITSEMELFLEACPAPIIGATGSNGKSTTATMLAAMLQADGRQCHLGGNIGRSLLPELHRISAVDWVVLELSSFQLAHLSPHAKLPTMAVVTNCAPNHLDWHSSYDDYRAAKQRLICEQPKDGWTVLGCDAEVARWASLSRGQVLPLLRADAIPTLAIPGGHNIANARCAATAALAVDCCESSVFEALQQFQGLPHRLQHVTEHQGRQFYEDSSATTPESVIAALKAIEQPTWLLAGGKEKGADFAELGEHVARLARGACFYGEARGQLYDETIAHTSRCAVHQTATLREALAWCWHQSQSGEAIVLSPACASYDQFRDYAHRAAMFRQWIGELTASEGQTAPQVAR